MFVPPAIKVHQSGWWRNLWCNHPPCGEDGFETSASLKAREDLIVYTERFILRTQTL